MPHFVRFELGELGNEVRRRETRQKQLAGVDIDGAVLAGVIHLDDAASEISGADRLRNARHGAVNAMPRRCS